MHIAICDDQEMFCERLEFYILKEMFHNGVENCEIDTYISSKDLLSNFQKSRYDGVFLDLDMPDIDGFDVAEQINIMDLGTPIVFVTSHEQWARRCFKFRPIEFVSKTTMGEEIGNAVVLMLKEIEKHRQFYSFKFNREQHSVRMSDIYCFRSYRNEVSIITREAIYKEINTIKNIERMLQGYFFVRASSSCLVNIKNISQTNTNECVLRNGEKITIGRMYTKNFKKVFLEYMLKNSCGEQV